MSVEEVTLSTSPFHIFNFDQERNELYITGAALEEGAWYGVSGQPTFYPRDVIHKYAHNFIGVDLRCEHGYTIGTVLDARLTELGFEIDAVVTHYDSIQAILRGDKKGLSINATIQTNERRMATAFVRYEEISVVGEPACRTCMINPPGSITEDRIAMSEDKTITEQVEAYAKLKECADNFKAARDNLSNVLLGTKDQPTDSEDEVVTMSEEQKTEEVQETTEVVEEAPAAEVAEGEATPETNAEGEATPEGEATEVEGEGETEPEGEGETEEEDTVTLSDFNAVKDEVTTLKAQLEAKDVQIAEMTAKLSIFTAQAAAKDAAERDSLMTSILSLDPNADKAVLDGMTNVQLSAYKATAEELAKPVVGAAKKSAQDVKLSAPKTENKDESVAAILGFLRGQH